MTVQPSSTVTESPSMGEARQTVFNIMGRHPCCFRDDEPLQDLIEDLARAISGAAQAQPKPPYPTGDADKKLATDWYTWGFQSGFDAARKAPQSADVAYEAKEPEAYRETVRRVAFVRETRMAEFRECLESIAGMRTDEPREPDDADWRFRCLSAVEAAKNTLALSSTQLSSPTENK